MRSRGGGVAGPSRGKAVAALAVFVAALLACAGATLLVGVPNLGYTAWRAGTPGLFVVRTCAWVGATKERHMASQYDAEVACAESDRSWQVHL